MTVLSVDSARPALFLGAVLVITAGVSASMRAVEESDSVRFVDAASESGVHFTHENGASPEKYLPETMSGGVVLFDYDNDGWLDILFVNGGSFTDKERASLARHRLFHNKGDGTFIDATEQAGLATSGYGMGACSADYDNDGWPDLYITSVGGDRLYRNTGANTFVDVTARAGIHSDRWSASCAFADIDNDGDVDLYVTRYVDFTPEKNKYCPLPGIERSYCHPNEYASLTDILLRNNGNGTFTDISKESGILQRPPGNGLGAVFADYDNDGWADIYVSNDSTPNFLFHNKGRGVFEEVGFRAGVAMGHDGKPLAGMGVDAGDIDGNGLLDLFVANLAQETHTLYRNLGNLLFADDTFSSGIGAATLPFTGFGTALVDYDNDADLDIVVANGHTLDNIALARDDIPYEQLNLLLQNNGAGKFKNVAPRAGSGFAIKKVSRGLAAGDIDNDGDIDLVISNLGQTADLLRNDGGNHANALLVRTIGTRSNRDGIGTRLRLTVNGKVQITEVKAGSSYLGQNDLRAHFGLGHAREADLLEIRWPSGNIEVFENIKANQILTVEEGKGVTSQVPFAHH